MQSFGWHSMHVALEGDSKSKSALQLHLEHGLRPGRNTSHSVECTSNAYARPVDSDQIAVLLNFVHCTLFSVVCVAFRFNLSNGVQLNCKLTKNLEIYLTLMLNDLA